MDTGKIYTDSKGQECSIWQMVRREPDWAANRVQEGEKAIDQVKLLETKLENLKRHAVCDCEGCMAIDDI